MEDRVQIKIDGKGYCQWKEGGEKTVGEGIEGHEGGPSIWGLDCLFNVCRDN